MKTLINTLLLSLFFISAYAQWHQVNSNTIGNISDMVFTDQNIGFFVSGENIYKTTDAGENWSSNFQDTGIEFTDVVATTNTVVCFGHNVNQGWFTYTSIDGGNTWTSAVFANNPYNIQHQNDTIFFTDLNDGFKLKKIINNQVNTVLGHSTALYGINQNEIIAVNQTYDTIFKSEDYGATWTTLLPFPNNFSDNNSNWSQIKSFQDTLVITASYGASVHLSTDNGDTWEMIYDEYIPTSNVILDSGKIYGAVYCNENGTTLSCITGSSDYGQNWELIQSGLSGGFLDYQFYFHNDNLGFAFTDNGVIYKTSNGGGLSITAPKILEKKIKLYPNPVKEELFITTGGSSIEKIELYDLRGKRIKSCLPKENVNTFTFNTSDCSLGIYILNIETKDNKSVSKKVIVE